VARPGRRASVERRQRLVDQPAAGLREQRARQSDALALAAGQPVDAREQLVGQVEARQRRIGLAMPVG
jgi:hypothetical protein